MVYIKLVFGFCVNLSLLLVWESQEGFGKGKARLERLILSGVV
jgi:hypothetical protein